MPVYASFDSDSPFTYLTRGKKYLVLKDAGSIFSFKDDAGDLLAASWYDSHWLKGRDWTREEREERDDADAAVADAVTAAAAAAAAVSPNDTRLVTPTAGFGVYPAKNGGWMVCDDEGTLLGAYTNADDLAEGLRDLLGTIHE